MKKSKSDEDKKILTFSAYSEGKVTGAIIFDKRRVLQSGSYPVKYRVTHNRNHKYIDSGYTLTESEWCTLPRTQNKHLKEVREMLTNGNLVIKEYIKDLNRANSFTFEALTKRIKKGDTSSVNAAFKTKIKELQKNGQVGTAGIYDSAIKSLTDFNKGRDIRFNAVNKAWLERYEKWFIGDDKNSYATASIYLRSLRAIFNEAIRDVSIPGEIYPFGRDRGKYEIPSSPGRKLALNMQQIKTIVEYKVKAGSTDEKMRDLWFFIYMANGMNIKDLVTLRWRNIVNSEIEYFREKTRKTTKKKQHIIVPVLAEMEQIIDKWSNNDRSPDQYVFGYLTKRTNTPENVRLVSQNLTRLMNKHLKKISEATGLPHISTYTARHSFSTALLRSGANVEFISEALGHSSIETTKAYLAGFETEARRKMNTNLLNFESDE